MAGALSADQCDRLWALRATGIPLTRVARSIGGHPMTVYGYVRRCGGVRPATRRRAAAQLTATDREEISRGLAAGLSLRSIAAGLVPPRPSSTVSREVARNGGRDGYRAGTAEAVAWARARRPKTPVLVARPALRAVVEAKLENEQWSPEQIAAWLKIEYPTDPEMRVSHETIYVSLFVQSRGALRKELARHLRTRRVMRRPAKANPDERRGGITGAVSISERPAEADDRAVPGHWEGDLLQGTAKDQIATLVERTSRFVLLIKIDSTRPEDVAAALALKITELPEQLWRSLTWDRGREMQAHARFTVATGIKVYFADPQSPWQRGSNENTNGLLRQYFPKGKSLVPVTQDQLDEVARKLNTRPRQTLQWMTPCQVLDQAMR